MERLVSNNRKNKKRAVEGGKDAYFTKPEVVDKCLSVLSSFQQSNSTLIEPSAGDGAFSNKVVCMAMDIEPKHSSIRQQDFLSFSYAPTGHTVVFGNPPFGFQATLALQFFNKAAVFADVIAFVLPASFKKQSIKNKLDRHFHLKKQINLPKKAFTLDGESYHVPAVFQVWEKSEKLRRIRTVDVANNRWIEFTDKKHATFAVRRVGGRAGQVLSGLKYNKVSTYFCKEKQPGVIDALKTLKFSCKDYTAGVRSVSQSEIVEALQRYYRKVK